MRAYTGDVFLTDLTQMRILAILRGNDPAVLLDAARTLRDAGIKLIEVSMSMPTALATLRAINDGLGDSIVLGAGTVISTADVRQALAAGARFIVTPGLAPSVSEAVVTGVPVLAGALTPSEVIAAAGSHAVKLFPAAAHGPSYLCALRDPFPDVPFVPVGGVTVNNAEEYWDAGAIAVGVGGALLNDDVETGTTLRERATILVKRARTRR